MKSKFELETPPVHIQSTSTGLHVTGLSKLQRAVIETAQQPVCMLELVEKVSVIRNTQFPARRIAELLTQMEASGYVRITK